MEESTGDIGCGRGQGQLQIRSSETPAASGLRVRELVWVQMGPYYII